MMISDVAYDLFTVFNALRLVCYLQQIYKIARDTSRRSGDFLSDLDPLDRGEQFDGDLLPHTSWRHHTGMDLWA